VEKWEPYAAATPGRKARVLLRFLHTGEALGLTGQAIAGVASLCGGFLVFTGLALAIRRFVSWLRARYRPARGQVPPLLETPEDAA
jgi:uncharacterized iron-regulated membrane protein